MVLYLWVWCHEQHLGRLSDKVWRPAWCLAEFLSLLGQFFAYWSLSTGLIQASLRIEPGLDHIKGRRRYRSQPSGDTSTQIIIQMMIPILNIKHPFQLFIHENNDWAEGHIHEVVHKEAPVKWHNSFIVVHSSHDLPCWDPLFLSTIQLKSLLNDLSRSHDWVMEQWSQNSDQGEPVAVLVLFASQHLFGLLVDREVDGVGRYTTHR